jgi:GNAT superfamily N-acetyltransferase
VIVIIRKIGIQDRDIFIKMMKEFYKTDAVSSNIPEENINNTFNHIIEDSPYVEGYFYTHKDKPVAYCLLSFTYSNEAGGLVLLIEELYVTKVYQGKKIGSSFLDFLENTYRDKIAGMRLEVIKTNIGARKLYYKKGFKDLKYLQLVKKINE